MDKLANAWKAGVGFIAPAATVIISATLNDSPGGSTITKAEWIVALCTAVVSASAVYVTPPGKNLKTPEV